MVSYCNYLLCAKDRLVSTERSTAILDSLDNTIEALEVFPNESANSQVLGYVLIGSVGQNVSLRGSADWNIINIRHRDFQYLRLENIGDVIMEYWN